MIKQFSFVLFLFCSALLIGQDLNDDQFYGHIITKKGKIEEGVIELKHSHLPWERQEKILFFDKKLLKQKKIKKKDKESYTPKDIDGFVIQTNDGDITYKKINYVNLAGANNADAEKIGTFNTLSVVSKNLSKSQHFAEVIYVGNEISIYKYFNSPAGFSISSEQTSLELDKLKQEALIYYDVLLDSENFKKAKEYKSINVKKIFGDCSEFMDKFENGELIRKPTKGIVSAFKNSMVEGEYLKKSALDLVMNYEELCK